jgi:hypothetical protein|tara:strand:+ start:1674 stop:1811 length:138 start_codon:yes stop_codon:yes gene_type:complete
MINWTKDNHIEWILISDKLVKEYKRNESKEKEKKKIIIFKKKKKD